MIHAVILEYPLTKSNRIKLARAFKDVSRVDLSIECAIEGQMGNAYVDNLEEPTSFKIELGPFNYFAGDSKNGSASTMLADIPPYTLLMPSSPGWLETARRIYGERLVGIQRYSYSSEQVSSEHLDKLCRQSAFNEHVMQMDRTFARKAWEQIPFVDLSNFDSPDDFIDRGVGYYFKKNSKLVGAAYGSMVCSRGIEISLFVKEDYRRQGIAKMLASHLIQWCLEHNAEPHWDAANLESCRLAEKLGYNQIGVYQAYYVVES